MARGERIQFITDTGGRTQQFRRFVATFALVSLSSVVLLWVLDEFDATTYLIVTFLSLLVAAELVPPASPEAVWWRRLRWLKAGGWLLIAFLIYERTVAVLQ